MVDEFQWFLKDSSEVECFDNSFKIMPTHCMCKYSSPCICMHALLSIAAGKSGIPFRCHRYIPTATPDIRDIRGCPWYSLCTSLLQSHALSVPRTNLEFWGYPWQGIIIPSPICPRISQVLPDLICWHQHSQIQDVICHRTTLDIPSCPWHGLFLFNLLRSKMSHLSQDTPACPRHQHSNMSHLFQDNLKYSHEVNRLY